jgi:hypothetical protein
MRTTGAARTTYNGRRQRQSHQSLVCQWRALMQWIVSGHMQRPPELVRAVLRMTSDGNCLTSIVCVVHNSLRRHGEQQAVVGIVCCMELCSSELLKIQLICILLTRRGWTLSDAPRQPLRYHPLVTVCQWPPPRYSPSWCHECTNNRPRRRREPSTCLRRARLQRGQ